ncbi:MAG: DUF4176 domain-containing protein [Butyrivibrio sp.]|nr:DUF4176 domain-containing protein [Butyrivibrio sp.]
MYNYDKVLPIGTVVLLKGATKRLMILGYQRALVKEPDRIYDYCGCVYPDGYLNPEQVAAFDHEQIERIYALGLQNDEEKVFQDKLHTIISERE